MIDLTLFEPDPDRAKLLDARMQKGLRDSLVHIRDEARGAKVFDETLLDRVINGIDNAQAYPPAAFGWYYELVFAILGEDHASVKQAAEWLSKMQPAEPGFQLYRIDDEDIADCRDMYIRRMGDTGGTNFLAPRDGDSENFADRLNNGLDLIKHVTPDLHGEIQALVRQIIMASGNDDDKMHFDGASVYQLWGALFLNPKYGQSPLIVAETLAHETAHSLLFGFTFDEPLVFNHDDELYPSPLRVDQRPMDGIYHATFVSARMHWTMRKISQNTGFDSATRDEAARAAKADEKNFGAGYKVVTENGRLSDTGRALMSTAYEYMAAAV